MREDDRGTMGDLTVCYKCVIDPFLGGQIRRNGTSTQCSLCQSKRRCVPLAQIVDRVESILKRYIHEGEFVRRWGPDGVVDSQGGDYVEYWVSELFGCDNIERIVQAVCTNLKDFHDDIKYERSPFRPDHFGHEWGAFQDGLKHGKRFFNDSAKAFLDWIFKDLGSYSASSEEHAVVRVLSPENVPPIYRARTCMTPESVAEVTADPASKLAAPPKDKAGEGRMNPAGVPAFYGAFARKTCVAELRPPVGGAVVSGEFRLNQSVRVLDFGRFETADLGPVPSFFDPKYFQKSGRQEFLRYLHDEMTVPVLPGMERNYLIPQVIAEYLATYCKPQLDGVIFKSVQDKGGSNIVLFSHAACSPGPTIWKLKGTMGILGPRSSNAPRIEYVEGSLMHHRIEKVCYGTSDLELEDDRPKAKVLETEW
ncbi:RES family NAD+ phosphorylase [Pseudomonas promysalinigenes]|uniref:RES family NAD+ phosphorylase n=1 Tax=Pseudomonas promysalinigenes TaxID=485898 RepID=UPI003F5AC51C